MYYFKYNKMFNKNNNLNYIIKVNNNNKKIVLSSSKYVNKIATYLRYY